ncbi:hypothetical protein SARC_13839 [Sphaeroforma arctica JP610]|uniref:Elongation of fatty acids protein n=1 Tax=Sphaeroforma arctica JP610 TaxID=667725 RepID=A0A0L0FAS6_9EUKA|nr:hypothetical protein SARC_13839 [Sphaeroforma arctica JP610]KNC73601.1 hypothetical protein SARC_13839 [Sphaeroforma arctica JP610]|eukprot:XP_014147503.1 hypothetical protein SARC_13839 [Sphaeroforma arctica JP610]
MISILNSFSFSFHRLTYASIGMMFNTFVHIFMYWYYFCATLKINVWFKRYITKLQIVQFITSFVLSVPYLYYHFQHGCVGMEAYIFSFFTNASFLLLFINFNNKTYHKKDTKKE